MSTSTVLGLRVVALAIGIAYVLAARLGLALTSYEGLPFFWPASKHALRACTRERAFKSNKDKSAGQDHRILRKA